MRAYHSVSGVTVLAAAGLIAGPAPRPPASGAQPNAVLLTATGIEHSPLGDGTALIMGGTSIPQPGERYLDAADALYLGPHGFGGTLQSLFTPENASATSAVRGEQILDATILQKINNGDVSADNPLVVFGYSQSAAISSAVMRQLAGQDVPSDDVHFVLIGNPDNPVGGAAVENSNLPASDVMTSIATPNDLYPTDVYTHEYDGVADFPIYKLNLLADLNAILGFIYEHTTYLSITPDDISNAIPLPTSAADTMVNYSMIPAETLPLVAPLQLIPVIGKPLYDLLEPDVRILVNLGYGNIEHGWAPGDADVVQDHGPFPTNLDFDDVLTALGTGLQNGVSAFLADLQNPETYQITPLVDNPSLAGLIDAGYVIGFLDTPQPTLQEALEGLGHFIQLFTAT